MANLGENKREIVKKVVVSGYSGFGNAGDEAILECLLQEFKAAAEEIGEKWQFTVLSADQDATAQCYGVKGVKRTSLGGIIQALGKSHLLVSGGGGLLQDVTGRFSVTYYLGICLLAALLGKPFFIYAQGIGPLRGKINRYVTRLMLNRASFLAVRDEASQKLLEAAGVKKKALLTADPAFCLQKRPTSRVDSLLKTLPPGNMRLAISLRPWPGVPLSELAATIDIFCRETGGTAVFLPFYRHTDLPLCRQAAAQLTGPSYVVEEELFPGEILAFLGEMDLLLGMRLHALIFAAAAGAVPVALSYDPKIDALMQRLALPVAAKASNISRDNLLASLHFAWKERATLRPALLQQAEAMKKEARQTARQAVKELDQKYQARSNS